MCRLREVGVPEMTIGIQVCSTSSPNSSNLGVRSTGTLDFRSVSGHLRILDIFTHLGNLWTLCLPWVEGLGNLDFNMRIDERLTLRGGSRDLFLRQRTSFPTVRTRKRTAFVACLETKGLGQLPFDHVMVWFSLRIQTRSTDNGSVSNPRRLNATPPSDLWLVAPWTVRLHSSLMTVPTLQCL